MGGRLQQGLQVSFVSDNMRFGQDGSFLRILSFVTC
jgi:hypothetical protein